MSELRIATRWNGIHEGFSYEIINWNNNCSWNYYIFFNEKNTPPIPFKELLEMPKGKYTIKYDNTWLSNLDWHFGITYCEFLYNSEGDVYSIKAGCDYSHLWDEGKKYTVDDVEMDAIRTIENAKEYLSAINEVTK